MQVFEITKFGFLSLFDVWLNHVKTGGKDPLAVKGQYDKTKELREIFIEFVAYAAIEYGLEISSTSPEIGSLLGQYEKALDDFVAASRRIKELSAPTKKPKKR